MQEGKQIQISEELARDIIERLECVIHQDWYHAHTMLSEEEHKTMYHGVDLEFIAKLQEALDKE